MKEYNEYQDKTILVTGGAGCVGSNLTRKFADMGAGKVIILDNLSSAYEWNIPDRDNIEFIQGDILDDAVLKRVFKQKPDYVYHLAAHFANQNSVDNPEKDYIHHQVAEFMDSTPKCHSKNTIFQFHFTPHIK